MILCISLLSTSWPRLNRRSSGFLGIPFSGAGTVAFRTGMGLVPWKFLVKPWLGVILPSAYLPVSGSGVVWTGLNSEPELRPLVVLRMVLVIRLLELNSGCDGAGLWGRDGGRD